MKSLIVSLIEKYHPFNVKYFKLVVVLAITVLSGIVLLLGWMSAKRVREVVTEDFNQQQLEIAKRAASLIEGNIKSLKRELTLLSLSPTIQYAKPPYPKFALDIAFSSIKGNGVLEVKFLDHQRRSAYHISAEGRCIIRPLDEGDVWYLSYGKREENKNRIFMSEITPPHADDAAGKLTMDMVMPVWQISVSEAYPVPTNKFSGVVVFVVDATELVKGTLKDIRSGKTGYAWIIDEKGTFLYHYEKEFIGKSSFEARSEKLPAMSFERIHNIQREKMLKGEEGTNWYTSGWHMGIEKEIKKLIAYTPVRLIDKQSTRLWSVGVVAPISEIEGAIHSIYVRHIALQALVISVIVFGGLMINFMILRWSNMLEQEVTRKTRELMKSEQRYKSLIENAEDIIFTVDYSGQISSINKYGANIFNRREEDIVGHNLSEIYPLPSAEELRIMVRKVIDTKESSQATQLVNIDGRPHWFNTKLRRLWDEAGNVYAVLGIARDVTAIKEKEKEEQRRQLELEKLSSMGTLAAGVAHEINNPLAIILGFTDMLIEKAEPGSREYDILKTIEKQAMNAKRVVENLLSFGRDTEYREELVDVNVIVETVLSIVKNTLFVHKISLEKHLQPDLPLIKADEGELEQVILNIINNAIYVMSGGGVLSVITRALNNNEQVEIRLADTGHGIKKEHRSRIFDPLFTTKKVGEGTGLGLSVSYGIVTKYNGTITFKTKTKEESPETGTTFIITFPASKR